jgi:hypothetical protein
MRNLILAVSLANLCFISVWQAILAPPFNGYHLEAPPFGINALALMTDVLLFAFFIWLSFLTMKRSCKKRGRIFIRGAFLVLTVVAFKNVTKHFFGTLSIPVLIALFGKTPAILIICGAAIFCIFMLAKCFGAVVRVARFVVLLLAPLAVIFFAQAALFIFQTEFTIPVKSPFTANRTPKSTKRVVWIIFDEFDYRAAFETRPEALELPEIDRLAGESFFATNAFPPAGETLLSMPSLITGRIVAEAKMQGPTNLGVRFAGENDLLDWRTEPNIFADAQKIGAATGAVGWYHPYCRLFPRALDQCTVTKNFFGWFPDKHPDSFSASMIDYFWRLGLTVPMASNFLPKVDDYLADREDFIAVIKNLSRQAETAAADRRLSLVLLHYPVPHQPYVYHRDSGEFSEKTGANYFDHLALMDRIFGNLRREMERTKTWNDSTVIVSSDHWWRTLAWRTEGKWTDEEAAIASAEKDFRIPFIVKPANPIAEDHLIYDAPFNTVLTHDLLLAILGGEVSSSAEIAAWIDRHRSVGKLEYPNVRELKKDLERKSGF